MQPGDRLVCIFTARVRAGTEFKQWPLHITLVPWFRTDIDSESLGTKFSRELADIQPFEVTAGKQEGFGYKKSKTANLILPSPQLIQLEARVRGVLHGLQAWIADETVKRKRDFRPHVTVQKDQEVKGGENIACEVISIVEQKGSVKAVIREVNLYEKPAA